MKNRCNFRWWWSRSQRRNLNDSEQLFNEHYKTVKFAHPGSALKLNKILIYKVVVKAYSTTTTLNESVVGSKEMLIHVVPCDKNIFIFDNEQYQIDPEYTYNQFCWGSTIDPTSSQLTIHIIDSDGNKDVMNIKYEERNKLTAISFEQWSDDKFYINVNFFEKTKIAFNNF